jgi:hypothetical protein
VGWRQIYMEMVFNIAMIAVMAIVVFLVLRNLRKK